MVGGRLGDKKLEDSDNGDELKERQGRYTTRMGLDGGKANDEDDGLKRGGDESV
jgi:hypothetical protein